MTAPPGRGRWARGMLLQLSGMVALVVLVSVIGLHLMSVSITRRTIERDVREEAALTAEALAAGYEHHTSLLSEERVQEDLNNLVSVTKALDRITIFRERDTAMLPFVSTEDSLPLVEPPTLAEQDSLRHGRTLTERRVSTEGGPYWRVLVPMRLDRRIRGAVEVRMSLQYASESLHDLVQRTRWVAVWSVVLCVVVLAFFLHWSVQRPVRRLLGTMARVEGGDLGAAAPPLGHGEFGDLSRGLNSMLFRIRQGASENEVLLHEIQRFNEELEQRVREKTVELEDRNVELTRVNRLLFDLEHRLAHLSRLAAVGQLSATLAHEIGTPLQSISGHLELLRERQAVSPEHQHRLEVIQSQLDRVAAIVRGVLQSTRPPGQERKPVRLKALLDELVTLLQPGLETRNIRMVLQVPGDLPLALGDSGQLQQLFLNLYTNAMDAMPEGGEIHTRVRVEEAMLVCEVSDTGPGIAVDLLERIFDPLFTTKPAGAGTGLGLTVARDVALRHGGTLHVSSQEGKGSRFEVRLPVYEETHAG